MAAAELQLLDEICITVSSSSCCFVLLCKLIKLLLVQLFLQTGNSKRFCFEHTRGKTSSSIMNKISLRTRKTTKTRVKYKKTTPQPSFPDNHYYFWQHTHGEPTCFVNSFCNVFSLMLNTVCGCVACLMLRPHNNYISHYSTQQHPIRRR